jgi:hypothetical protein
MASDINQTSTNNVNNAFNQGQSSINSFDPTAWASNTQSGLKDIWNQQGTTQNDYVNAYKNAIASNPTATDLYNKANTQFNVPALQNTANTLNNTMLTTPNSNLAAARGFNVDQNQIDQKTSQDLQRLAPAAAAAQTNANTAMSNAGNFVQAGLSQNATNLLPIQEQGQYLMDSYARQQSGFTTTAQQQLQALQAKMEAGQQLSAQEMSAYASLASAESNYQGALASANATVNAAKLNNQFQTVPAGQNLINTFKGTMMNPSILTSRTGVATYGNY